MFVHLRGRAYLSQFGPFGQVYIKVCTYQRLYISESVHIRVIYIYFGHLLTWCKNIWLQVYRHKKLQLKQQEQDMLNCP